MENNNYLVMNNYLTFRFSNLASTISMILRMIRKSWKKYGTDGSRTCVVLFWQKMLSNAGCLGGHCLCHNLKEIDYGVL
ncbi:hypothetical protein EB796_000775 [Bugula neritina]|uniref:Uncharacterized protein n=1 Tax=Bugula neritina TaxID=10212 RepID=A0A7J7KRY4_BUGNE|nr:hypothetical protein EB796_000775 [Bugula neritina]